MKNASSGISKKGTKIIGIMVNDMHKRDEAKWSCVIERG